MLKKVKKHSGLNPLKKLPVDPDIGPILAMAFAQASADFDAGGKVALGKKMFDALGIDAVAAGKA